jgi:hypothetical protein
VDTEIGCLRELEVGDAAKERLFQQREGLGEMATH